VLDDRKLAVLRAIVEDFVSTNEPVGSRALVDRHNLDVSPATIRNDMAVLEEQGYIVQPHTSAGRIPTDKGYRLFVDRLSGIKPFTRAERRAIETFLNGAYDLDDVVMRTVRLLAQLTRQVAVVQYPSLSKSSIRHVELVPLNESRLLLVLITDTGRVEQRVVELPGSVDEDSIMQLRAVLNACLDGRKLTDVASIVAELPARVEQRVVDLPGSVDEDSIMQLRAVLNACLDGRKLTDVASIVAELPGRVEPRERANAAAVFSVILETLVARHEEKIVVGGASNLTPADFSRGLREVLEALEEQVVLMRLLGEFDDQSAVTVKIGAENDVSGLRSTSVVAAGYGSGDRPLAKLGVVGPTRMDYPTAMGAVRAVARYTGQILAES